MKKIPSLFKRKFDTHRIYNEITEGCEWVVNGEGIATRKYDGTACLIQDGGWFYKRYDCKKGRAIPKNGFACQSSPDPGTLHWPWWVPVAPEDKYHWEAFNEGPKSDGTYELCGPKINGNPEGLLTHELIHHGMLKYPQCPVTFDEIKEFLIKEKIEGIVWYRGNGEMCKIKLKDYGIKREKA